MSDFYVRISVVALFVLDDEVLLLHQMTPPEPDCWDLPGGGLEPHEDLMTCLQREVLEEIGVADFQVQRLLAIAEAFYEEEDGRILHKLDIIYQCQLPVKLTQFQGSDEQEIGSKGIQWLPVLSLTPDQCASRAWKAFQAAGLGLVDEY